ncbi:ATP-binding protein [Treponema primitia]|uniref:ATP-binding protein n=1 Tax=Treponema primitia TaxID=88058 RepID=UPI0002555301|nr:ATP-binding protein [Treponema primitia]
MLINRPIYLNKLISYKDTAQLIKVITGMRRCGKSTMFELYQDYLITHGGVKPAQIQSINLEDARSRNLLEWETLNDHIETRLISNKKNYIFLDEIQNVTDFQRALDSLHLKKNVDLYVTGSNAYLLSGELATLLSGRYVEIKMFPLSFKEYVSTFSDKTNLPKKFNDYLRNSSFPYTLNFKGNRTQINDYLDAVYNAVILKDVMQRTGIADLGRLEKVVQFIFDNIGNETSINNIKNKMASDNFKIDARTIENYLEALLKSFILYKVGRYDVKGKELLKTNDKYYVADIGLRYFLLKRNEGDIGHILENIVYLELLHRGYNISIGKIGSQEVDFVAEKEGDITEYYQVAQTVIDPKTFAREIDPLDKIDDHYPKFLLSMDYMDLSHKGIKQINVLDWLIA